MHRPSLLTSLERLVILTVSGLAALASPVYSSEAAQLSRGPYTYIDEASRPWCGTVEYIEANGPGGVSFGWFVFDKEPRRLVHVPMAELLAGCVPQR